MKHGPPPKPETSVPVKGVQTSNWCLIARESVEPFKMGKQKIAIRAGSLIDDAKKWKSIDWKYARRQVRRLQVRIAKAVKEGRWNKVKSLQYLLTRSFYAKLLAVKRVTTNKGKKTPGMDGVLWKGARTKWRAVFILKRRGYIKKGFTFLGQTFKKHGRVLHITPAKEGVLALIRKVGTLIRKHVSTPMPVLIKKLNESLCGWANYHRHVVASEAFGQIDTYVFEQLWRMVRRRHQNKSKGWLIGKYWLGSGRKHVFAVKRKHSKGTEKIYQVLRVRAIGIRRYIKIKADANPYLPEYARYFWRRRQDKESKLLGAMSAREYRALATV